MEGNRFEQAEAAHALRLSLRKLQCNDAAIGMPDQVKTLVDVELRRQHPFDQADFIVESEAGHCIAVQVDGDQSIAAAHALNQLPPLLLRAHGAMQQNDGSAV